LFETDAGAAALSEHTRFRQQRQGAGGRLLPPPRAGGAGGLRLQEQLRYGGGDRERRALLRKIARVLERELKAPRPPHWEGAQPDLRPRDRDYLAQIPRRAKRRLEVAAVEARKVEHKADGRRIKRLLQTGRPDRDPNRRADRAARRVQLRALDGEIEQIRRHPR
jgi:hypothetical protein